MQKLVFVLVFALIVFVSAAPLLHADSEEIIPNRYIVVLHKTITVEQRDAHIGALLARTQARNSEIEENIINKFHIGNLIGFSASLSKLTLHEELSHPEVRYIDVDQNVYLSSDDDPILVQTGATWGLDRIDKHDLPLDGTFHYYNSSGNNVDAYVVDTGVYLAHSEFEGRAIWGKSFIPGEADVDGNGHGTHVSGTIGGKTYGVAKKVTIIAVKVLGAGGSGSWSGVIGGIDFVTSNSKARGKKSVANLSLGGGPNDAVDEAVEQSILAGVTYAIAAGNSNAKACNYSPARVKAAITVGATTNTDSRASFSNWGICVDIFAPGSSITSAWIGSVNAINTISGTSMAAPHVAGAAALHLGHSGAFDTPNDVERFLLDNGTPDKVLNPGVGSPNILLYSPTDV